MGLAFPSTACYPGPPVRLSIPGKIFAGFVALLVTFGGVSGYTAWQIHRLGRLVGAAQRTLVPLPPLLGEVKSDLQSLALATDPRDPALLRRSVHLARRVHPYLRRIEERFARARDLLSRADSTPEIVALARRLDELESLRARLDAAARAFFDAVEAGTHDAAQQRRVLAAVRSLGRDVARFEVEVTDLLDRTVTAFEQEEHRALWGTLLLTAVAMVVGIVITLLAGRLLSPLRTLREAVERVARGEYDQPVRVTTRDELGALAADFNRMAEAIRNRDARLSAQQKELIHQERLATVGRMSAQITHELRNPLSSIGLNSELLMEELEQSRGTEEARNLLLSIIEEVERLREITEEYLQFARPPRPEPAPTDLNHIAGELLEFVRSEMEQSGVRARLDADRAARPALVDPNQLRAALLNLLRNAREALEPRGGGHVVVRVRTLGSHATVEVTDDGPGMSPEAMEHLFEPFFSTKEQGTGLGLSLVRQIVESQGGTVTVRSEPGRGTTVRLELPLAPASPAAEPEDEIVGV